MSIPKTLMAMADADLTPSSLKEACLVLIDIQNEYFDGPLKVANGTKAVTEAKSVLDKARAANTPIIHIAHKGRPGGAFDRSQHRGQIISQVIPAEGETLIEKTLPNAFAGTSLYETIEKAGRKQIILVGFMTHMCISSTARGALDLGLRSTIVETACSTRDLEASDGTMLAADTVQQVALAELRDRFAIVVKTSDDIVP